MGERASSSVKVLCNKDVFRVKIATDCPSIVHVIGHRTELQPADFHATDPQVD